MLHHDAIQRDDVHRIKEPIITSRYITTQPLQVLYYVPNTMTLTIPDTVARILDSLSAADKETVLAYIQSLQSQSKVPDADADTAADDGAPTPMEQDGDGGVEHPKYDAASGAEDFDAASDLKQQAADCKDAGDYDKALELYNQAVLAAPPSALLYANRAMVLEKLGHYKEAALDCTWALELNPDSAKALKVRGKLRYKQFKDWHGALSDLNQAQTIDFDPDVAELLKELTELRKQEELEQAQERIQKEEALKRKAQEIKQAQEQAKREQARSTSSSTSSTRNSAAGGSGMPGMPGGMPGMPGMDPSMMAGLMDDPEIQAAMQNPKVLAAFQDLMSGPGGPMALLSNPAKLQQLMTDPEVGPVLQKLMSKFMGGGGMGGMPGGGNSTRTSGGGDVDDIPDLGEMPELD